MQGLNYKMFNLLQDPHNEGEDALLGPQQSEGTRSHSEGGRWKDNDNERHGTVSLRHLTEGSTEETRTETQEEEGYVEARARDVTADTTPSASQKPAPCV